MGLKVFLIALSLKTAQESDGNVVERCYGDPALGAAPRVIGAGSREVCAYIVLCPFEGFPGPAIKWSADALGLAPSGRAYQAAHSEHWLDRC